MKDKRTWSENIPYFVGIDDGKMDSMRVLSETAGEYPEAVSFSSGAPYGEDFVYSDLSLCLRAFEEHIYSHKGNADNLIRKMFHYSDVNGFIGEVVAQYIQKLEGVNAKSEHIMITNGFQEALLIVLRGLCSSKDDVLLSIDPAYVGVFGAAKMLDIDIRGVQQDAHLITNIDTACDIVEQKGGRVFGLYVNPDNNNPSGVSMSLTDRYDLIECAERRGFFILEDNPYRIFSKNPDEWPSLKKLDKVGCVISLGSFAKSIFPGARLGYIVAEQYLKGSKAPISSRFTAIKSMYSVGTSSLSQAVVAGAIVSSEYDLDKRIERARDAYLHRLKVIIRELEVHFPASKYAEHRVKWVQPNGGFFVVLSVGFKATLELMRKSAREFGVSWAPMHMFYLEKGGEYEIRLGFSNLNEDQIVEGIRRFAAFNGTVV